jgi:hypothetical protein
VSRDPYLLLEKGKTDKLAEPSTAKCVARDVPFDVELHTLSPWQFTCKLQEHSTSHHGINRQTQEVTHKPNMQTPVPLSSWPGNYVAQKSQVALDSVPPVYSAGNNLCQASQDTFSRHFKTRITSCATPYANSMTLLRNIAVAALRDSHVYNYCRAYSLIPFLLLMETSFRA